MKRNYTLIKSLFYFCSLCMAFCIYGCTEDEKVVSNYIKLSLNSYTFGAGEEALEIKVDANPAWTVEIEGDWVEIVNESANSLSIKSQSNLNGEVRTAVLTFSSADVVEKVTLSQLTEYIHSQYRMVDSDLNLNSAVKVSQSGKYLGACRMHLEGEALYYTPLIIDVATGKRTECAPARNKHFSVIGVTDDGSKLFYSQDDGECGYFMDGKSYFFEAPAGYSYPDLFGISADGSVVVGSAMSSARRALPVKWVNGIPEELPIPAKYVVAKGEGENKEEVDYNYAILARGCSADGSVIVGDMRDTNGTAVYWKDGKVGYVSGDKAVRDSIWMDTMLGTVKIEVIERATIKGNLSENISPNGKYIAVAFVKIRSLGDGVKRRRSIPAFFNTETGETTFINELPGDGQLIRGGGTTVTDDGVAFFSLEKIIDESYSMGELIGGYSYNLATGEITTTKEYLLNEHSLFAGDGLSWISKVCSGGDVVMGRTYQPAGEGGRTFLWYVAPPM